METEIILHFAVFLKLFVFKNRSIVCLWPAILLWDLCCRIVSSIPMRYALRRSKVRLQYVLYVVNTNIDRACHVSLILNPLKAMC